MKKGIGYRPESTSCEIKHARGRIWRRFQWLLLQPCLHNNWLSWKKMVLKTTKTTCRDGLMKQSYLSDSLIDKGKIRRWQNVITLIKTNIHEPPWLSRNRDSMAAVWCFFWPTSGAFSILRLPLGKNEFLRLVPQKSYTPNRSQSPPIWLHPMEQAKWRGKSSTAPSGRCKFATKLHNGFGTSGWAMAVRKPGLDVQWKIQSRFRCYYWRVWIVPKGTGLRCTKQFLHQDASSIPFIHTKSRKLSLALGLISASTSSRE